MGKPKYFLRIEVAYQKHGLLLSQRKYVLDLLEEAGLLECKHASTPMEANIDLWRDDTSLLDDAGRYRRLIGKLIYLIVTRPDITFAVGVLSRFMHKHREVHWITALKILAYVKSCPGKGLLYKKHDHTHISAFSDAGYAGDMGDRKSISGFCTYVGGNLVTWRSKKQDVVSRSSAEAEYRAMAHTACEMIWLRKFMTEFGFVQPGPMPMHCDNQDAWEKKIVSLIFTPSSQQLADILTKATSSKVFSTICDKLGMIDIYAPA
ncbi:uncharacterized protein LOC109838480 [Asparagus officinalis]|uniref:uncharacterized protein LOC109838480 n=1 Tax=Asparagus officinalis TaxID=4686 RepID=UPI00098E39C8|nr:uncharacterized protein LOC109838480 [Asparagus officinalis]